MNMNGSLSSNRIEASKFAEWIDGEQCDRNWNLRRARGFAVAAAALRPSDSPQRMVKSEHKMKHRHINNSNLISELGYDSKIESLEVLFKNGTLSTYSGINYPLYDQLLDADDIDVFFKHHIQNAMPVENKQEDSSNSAATSVIGPGLTKGAKVFDVGVPKRIGTILKLGHSVSEVRWGLWKHKSGRVVFPCNDFVSNNMLRLATNVEAAE